MSNTTKKKADPVAPGSTSEAQTDHGNDQKALAIVPSTQLAVNMEPKVDEAPLSAKEKATLKKCEEIIKKGIKGDVATAKALRTINDKRLYREKCKTFKEYVAGVFKMGRSYAYDLIQFDEVRENLSTMADKKIKLPENERQARLLAKLKPQQQLEAWQTAISKSANGQVKFSDVQEAVSSLMGPVPPKLDQWIQSRIARLANDAYRLVFDQPLPWADELADLYCEAEDVYLKFINKVDVANVLYAIALKAEFPTSYVIINGEDNKCAKVKPDEKGELSGLFCPHLNFFAKQAGVHVEFKGLLYEAGDMDDKAEMIWKPATDTVLLGLFNKYTGNEAQEGKAA